MGLFLASAWVAAPRVYRLLIDRHYRDEWMTYSDAPDRVVYEEEPNHAAQLVRQGTHLYCRERPPAVRVPESWRQVVNWSEGTAFLHARSDPTGVQRIVAIDIQRGGAVDAGYTRDVDFYVSTMLPGQVRYPYVTEHGGKCRLTLSVKRDDVVSVFAGTADPDDAGHFTIRYTINGCEGWIDGWLNRNGTVSLQKRGGEE